MTTRSVPETGMVTHHQDLDQEVALGGIIVEGTGESDLAPYTGCLGPGMPLLVQHRDCTVSEVGRKVGRQGSLVVRHLDDEASRSVSARATWRKGQAGDGALTIAEFDSRHLGLIAHVPPGRATPDGSPRDHATDAGIRKVTPRVVTVGLSADVALISVT